jgi:hypothetical protein
MIPMPADRVIVLGSESTAGMQLSVFALSQTVKTP